MPSRPRAISRPTFVSDNIERLFGYSPSEYLHNPNFWRERVHPEDLQRVEGEMANLFKEGRHALEYRFRRKDGSYCWVNDDQHLVRDEEGEPAEIVGSWSDITTRIAAEAAEEEARKRLALLLESAPAVIYSFKAKDDYAPTFISENIKRLLGYCPEEYLKDSEFWRGHVHPDDIERVEAEQALLFEQERHTSEYRFRKKDGHYRWVSDEQHLIRDANGKPLEIVGSWSDITGRKHAEEAEDAARARLSSLLESAPSVIYSFKAKDDYAPTFVSENIKRLLGYCPEKYLEHADFWRNNVHPEDLAAVEAEQAKLFEKGRHLAEYRFRKKNGTYIWVSDDQYLLRGDDGEPAEIVGSWSNITARKQAEQAESAARARFGLMLHSAPAVVYSFAATGRFHPDLRQREHQARARLRARRLSEEARLLALACASRRPRHGGEGAGQALRGRPPRRRVPFPQGRQLLLLGERRAASGQGPERPSARGDRLVERGHRAQDGRAGGACSRASSG